jgi:hypothetical protein
MQLKDSAVKKVTEYIDTKARGANKMESAQRAGYSVNVSRKPSIIEHTKTYQSIVDRILTENAGTMNIIAESLNEDAKNGVLDELKPLERAQLYKIIVDVNDKLIPKVTLKESTDKNGNVTRTAWAQNASQVQEVMTDKEDIEEEK